MNALDIKAGAELLEFTPREWDRYTVLTGFETESGICWYCGELIIGRRKGTHFCKGHGDVYRQHFEWGPASHWALRRADHKCENCGVKQKYVSRFRSVLDEQHTNLEVHHIIPINGQPRFYSAFNLPWNLIVLCHDCHWELHRIMNGDHKTPKISQYDYLISQGQYPMEQLLYAKTD